MLQTCKRHQTCKNPAPSCACRCRELAGRTNTAQPLLAGCCGGQMGCTQAHAALGQQKMLQRTRTSSYPELQLCWVPKATYRSCCEYTAAAVGYTRGFALGCRTLPTSVLLYVDEQDGGVVGQIHSAEREHRSVTPFPKYHPPISYSSDFKHPSLSSGQ